MAVKEPVAQKLRIKIKAYDNKIIDNSARQIVEAAERQGVSVFGPIPLADRDQKVRRESFDVRTQKLR